jgi:uncharacterized membrane protein
MPAERRERRLLRRPPPRRQAHRVRSKAKRDMDLTPYLTVFVFLHIVSAFLFATGHGVSIFVAFRVRDERDPARMLALLDLSRGALAAAGLGLLGVLLFGILAGIAGGWFNQAWTWLSIVLLVVIGIAMTPAIGSHMAALRQALGQRSPRAKASEPDPLALPFDDVVAMAQTKRPEATLAIGGVGLVALLYLMTFKPF